MCVCASLSSSVKHYRTSVLHVANMAAKNVQFSAGKKEKAKECGLENKQPQPVPGGTVVVHLTM